MNVKMRAVHRSHETDRSEVEFGHHPILLLSEKSEPTPSWKIWSQRNNQERLGKRKYEKDGDVD